jgi:protein TonB
MKIILIFSVIICGSEICYTQPDTNKIEITTSDSTIIENINDETIYDDLVSKPEFPGGEYKLSRTIADRINYPESAAYEGIQGTVFLKVEIKKDGSIGKIEITGGVNDALNKEAINVIKSLPRFIPGKNENGNPVNAWYYIRVTFRLS